jgi:hypothetical protein
MADRGWINEKLQVGKEASVGAGGSANRRLPNLKQGLQIAGDFMTVRGDAQKYNQTVVPGDEWGEGPASSIITYGEVLYPLCSIVSKPTDPTVGAQGEYVWNIDPDPDDPDTVATYTFEKGRPTKAEKWNGVFWNELTMDFDRKSAQHSGTIIGQRISVGNSLTGTPTKVENKIVVPQKVALYYATSWANLVSAPTKITRAFKAQFHLGPKYMTFFPMDDQVGSWAGFVENPDGVAADFSLDLGLDTSGTDFGEPLTLDDMRTGRVNYFKIIVQGPLIGGSIYYAFSLKVAVALDNPIELKPVQGLYGGGFKSQVVTDDAADLPYSFSVTNMTATL